ncbi:hypothetical protein PF005_g19838 [Phytophthora fragariae]|nr:hypothetical protein PF006_g21559 [Phytophthora fragariae]KAE9188978.1 hypothetical protein PF005_g19838 [Phytophthora fragariae]
MMLPKRSTLPLFLLPKRSSPPPLFLLPKRSSPSPPSPSPSDDDVVWIPAPSGLPVTTGTGSVRNADDGRDDSEASETEWVPTENLAAPPSTAPQLYNIRAITNSYMRNEPLSVEPSLKTKLATAVDDFETRNLHQRAAVADHFDDFAELFTSR